MDVVSTTAFDGSQFERSYVSNIFVDHLHRLLRKEWSTAMKWLESTMVLRLDERKVLFSVKPIESVLAYVSGCLLHRILRCRSMDPGDFLIRRVFVKENSITQEEAVAADIPTETIKEREKHCGSLYRPGKAWFAFVSLLEALYIENTNAKQARRYQGRLLEYIHKATRESIQLRRRFMDTFPAYFAGREFGVMWRVYFTVVLPWYMMMKGRDFLCKLRQHIKMKEGCKGLDTRTHVYAASMASGKARHT